MPESLPEVWWKYPVLILSAIQNSVLEEVIVVGYLLRRLGQLGWTPMAALVASSVLRGSYHLYQGIGGFLGNVVMGVVHDRLRLGAERLDQGAATAAEHADLDGPGEGLAQVGTEELLPLPGLERRLVELVVRILNRLQFAVPVGGGRERVRRPRASARAHEGDLRPGSEAIDRHCRPHRRGYLCGLDAGLVHKNASFSPEWTGSLKNGTTIGYLGASWGAGVLKGTLPEQDGKWGVAPMPSWDGKPASGMLGGTSFAVTKDSKQQAAAVTFAEWMSTTEAGVKARIASGTSSAFRPRRTAAPCPVRRAPRREGTALAAPARPAPAAGRPGPGGAGRGERRVPVALVGLPLARRRRHLRRPAHRPRPRGGLGVVTDSEVSGVGRQ
ncbi:extracellular solute-binding protein, partial [Streptomyces massasporeus]